MAAYDAITEEPPPSRNWDEEEGTSWLHSQDHLAPVKVSWTQAGKKLLKSGKISTQLLIITTSATGNALIVNLGIPVTEIGQIPASGSQHAETSIPSSVIMMEGLPSVFILCHDAVPPERSTAWVKGALSEIIPEQLLVLGSLLEPHFRGRLEPGKAPLFRLQTREAKETCEERALISRVPFLPTGNLLSGLPAAIMSYCRCRFVEATCVLMVEQSVDVEPSSFQALLETTLECLQLEVGHSIDRVQVVERAFRSLRKSKGIGNLQDMYV